MTGTRKGDELEQFGQIFDSEVGVAQDAFENLGMESLGSVKRDGGALARGILVDDVAAALASDGESELFQDGTNLASSEPGKLGHQTAISTVERLTET